MLRPATAALFTILGIPALAFAQTPAHAPDPPSEAFAGDCSSFRQIGDWYDGLGVEIRATDGVVCGGPNATQPFGYCLVQVEPGCEVMNQAGVLPDWAFHSLNVTGSTESVYNIVSETSGKPSTPEGAGVNLTFPSTFGFCLGRGEAGWATITPDVQCTAGVVTGCPNLKDETGAPYNQSDVPIEICLPLPPVLHDPYNTPQTLGSFHNSTVQEALNEKSEIMPSNAAAALGPLSLRSQLLVVALLSYGLV